MSWIKVTCAFCGTMCEPDTHKFRCSCYGATPPSLLNVSITTTVGGTPDLHQNADAVMQQYHWAMNQIAASKPKCELTESDKALHRAIGNYSVGESKRYGAGQYISSGGSAK